jgi:hypothetical protein
MLPIMNIPRHVATATIFLTLTSCAASRDTIPNITARAAWSALGCYTDNVSGRTLPNGAAVPGGSEAMTNEACQTACLRAGFPIAGTEYAGECCKWPAKPPY